MKKKLYVSLLASALVIPAVVLPANAKTPFPDISVSSPYAEAVTFLHTEKIINDYMDQPFRPAENITRGHVLSILTNIVDLKPIRDAKTFADVPTTHPYYEVVQKFYRAGLIDGYQDHTFEPDTPITRAQVAKVLAVAFQLKADTAFAFQDVPKTHWSNPYIQALAGNGISTVMENGFYQPNEQLTRGQYALFLYRLLHIEEDLAMTTHIGHWRGAIDIPQSPLHVQLTFSPDGKGTFSVPVQGVMDYPVEYSITGDTIRVDIDLAGSAVVIEGAVAEGQLTATFTQNEMTFPLVLTPYEEPKEPEVSYEEWKVPVRDGALKVAIEWPKVEVNAPIPVAIIIAGSGPTTKDGNTVLGENNSLKMLAEELAAQGIATIRYDKRGVGDNLALVAKEEELLFDHYAQDVESIVKAVNVDKRFAAVHIIGHSEGSLVGMIAARSTKVKSIISIAGAGRPIEDILIEQLTPKLPEEIVNTSKNILASLKKGELVEDVPESLYSLFRPSVQPYMVSWLQYDPAEILKSLDVETLIIQGKNDLQVQVTDAEHLSAAKSTADVVYFDTMNHVLKEAPTDEAGNMATYVDPTFPLAKGLVDSISSFILR